jgi:alkylated DNA repair dioxygenase AlkB
MSDLFLDRNSLERLPAFEAEIYLKESFIEEGEAEFLMDRFRASTDWKQEDVVVWGRRHKQPRLVAWFGDETYSYSGITLNPSPWTKELRSIKLKIENLTGAKFNSVLLNFYRDGQDSMGAHSDDEPELGRNPEIASVSLGATRRIRFIPRNKKYSVRAFSVPLNSGSLLVMKGRTQENWLHEIPKEGSVLEARINLTFRLIRSTRDRTKGI